MNFSSFLKDLQLPTPETHPSPSTRDIAENYRLVDDETTFSELLSTLAKEKNLCIDTETTSLDPLTAELVGIGIGVEEGTACYIPTNGTLGFERAISALKTLLEDPKHSFFGHNIKYDLHILKNCGIEIAKIGFDTILASYVLHAHERQHSLDSLSQAFFHKTKIPIEELIGKGKYAISMKNVPIDKVCHYCCEDVDYTMRLKNIFEKELAERSMTELFYRLELPSSKSSQRWSATASTST